MELLLFLLLVLLVIWQLIPWGLTAEKAEIFLSQREPDDKPGGVFNPAGFSEPTVCNGTFQRKGHDMNTQIKAEEQLMTATHGESEAPEVDELAQSSFTAEEIAALFWLRGWYQSGGSDRMQLVRHWEFLKWLVGTGKLAP